MTVLTIRTRLINPQAIADPGEYGAEIILVVRRYGPGADFLGITSYNWVMT